MSGSAHPEKADPPPERRPSPGKHLSSAGWIGACLAVVLLLVVPHVRAHPDGEIACRARLQLVQGVATELQAQLTLDAAHSNRLLSEIKKPGTGQIDPAMLDRLRAVLNNQFGRFNWLYSLAADGRDLPLQVRDTPQLAFEKGRVTLLVIYRVSAGHPARTWSLRCADPTYYWYARFSSEDGLSPPVQHEQAPESPSSGGHQTIKPAARPDEPAALMLEGCPKRMALPPATGTGAPRPGIAQLDWRCDP